MIIFDFDKIIKKKYLTRSSNYDKLSFEEYKKLGLEKIIKLFSLYFTGISENYIQKIFDDNNRVKILLFAMGQKFVSHEIISIIIYHKTILSDKIKYYVLCFGTHYRLRKYGYGKYSLDEFINWIKIKDKSDKQKIILLKSVESSLKFYLTYGFKKANLSLNKLFFKYEPIDELKLNQEKILEYYFT